MDAATAVGGLPVEMNAYERQVWASLNAHWERRNNKRGLPNWVGATAERGGKAVKDAAVAVRDKVPPAIAEPIGKAAEAASDAALKPVLASMVKLLDLVNAWTLELNDPKSVERLAQRQGVEITDFSDLRGLDLKSCDRLLARNTLQWRTLGALEGGAMGALALVPVAGLPVSIAADVLVIQVLSTSIAARVAYSYGFDAKDPVEQEFIERLVARSFFTQAAKAAPMRDVRNAAVAINGRVNWSAKLRADHRLIAALEKLLQQLGPKGAHISVQSVAKVVPFIGIVLGAGMNAHALGAVAEDAKRFCQTRFLCERYGLPLPKALASLYDEANDPGQDRND